MNLLHAGVDITVTALWLGHESPATTRIYLHADMALKEQAIARTAPPGTGAGRYQPPDELLAKTQARYAAPARRPHHHQSCHRARCGITAGSS